MSTSKNKWFEVTTTKVVSAPNKTEAETVARSTRRSTTTVTQIPASEARLTLEA